MSTINQRRLVMARRIVQKLIVSSAMTDNPKIGPRTISTPRRAGGKSLKQIVTDRVRDSAVGCHSIQLAYFCHNIAFICYLQEFAYRVDTAAYGSCDLQSVEQYAIMTIS